MSRDDEMTEAADEALEMLNQAPRGGADHDDQIETGIEQDTPTAGGDEVEFGVVREGDDDDDEADDDHAPESVCRFCETHFPHEIAEQRHHCMGRDATHTTATEVGHEIIDPGVHEFEGQFLFVPGLSALRGNQDGTAPFFAIASNFDQCLKTNEDGEFDPDGTDSVGAFDAAGDTWILNHEEDRISSWESGIATRPGDAGEVYKEYNIGVVATDEVGRKRCNFQFRIAAPDLKTKSGDPVGSLPDDLPEGIRVQIDSANVEPAEAFEILRALMDQMDVDPDYFQNQYIHEWSRVVNFALYVRILRELSESKIVCRDGIIERLAKFSSRRRGSGEWKWNNKEIVGHRHGVALDTQSLEKLYEGHTVGKLLKPYHPKHPREEASDDPLSHPKLEVQYSTEYSDPDHDKIAWSDPDGYDFQNLRRECDEFLMYALNAAGLSLRADGDTYVSDQYWPATERRRDLKIHADKPDELRETEEQLTTYHLASDEASSSERAVLHSLADGGRPMDRHELAENSGTSTSTVQRAYETFGPVIARIERGVYDIADDVVRDKVTELLDGLEDLTEWVENGIDAIVNGRGEISEDSALATWARNHRARIRDNYDGLEVELAGDRDLVEVRRVLRAGLEAARATGSKAARDFADAQITFKIDGDRRTQKAFSRIGSGLKILGAEDVDLV